MAGNQGSKESAGAMNVLGVAREALLPFGDEVVFGEHASVEGDSAPDFYYSLSYTTVPADYADDEPQHERWLMTAVFHCPRTFDHCSRVRQTKAALQKAGFTRPTATAAGGESGQRIVFEFELADGVELDG